MSEHTGHSMAINHERKMVHQDTTHIHEHQYNEHAGHSIEGFKTRFLVSCFLTIPILVFSHTIQHFLGLEIGIDFVGLQYVIAALSTVLFFYGGYPFLQGTLRELQSKRPGMMTLIGVDITSAYCYGIAIAFGLSGMDFSWELATLIDIMLLGHWIEMKSVLGASNALEALVKLMPSVAHRQVLQGQFEDIPISSLGIDDIILVRPGEKFPADGIIITGSGSVNEALVTGESKPVTKKKRCGDRRLDQRRRIAYLQSIESGKGFISFASNRSCSSGTGISVANSGSCQSCSPLSNYHSLNRWYSYLPYLVPCHGHFTIVFT